jgi:hypothetical protein
MVFGAGTHNHAQQADAPMIDALNAANAGATIPMSLYVEPSSKDGKAYVGLLVGGNPLIRGPFPVTVDAVLIPVIVEIISNKGVLTTFDPTQPDKCDSDISAVEAFRQSPIVHASDLTFNGVKVGHYQWVDGFMRAEFWNEIGGSPSYSNPIRWSFAKSAFTLPPFVTSNQGVVQGGAGCGQYGLVSKTVLQAFIEGFAIPFLQAAKVISPTKLAAFLFRNVVSTNSVPLTGSCCVKGFHNYVGTPAQTYAVMDFNTSTNAIFGGVHDITTASHELAEWMNDPLDSNATPPWNQNSPVPASSCNVTLEVGDPLTGTIAPALKRNGYLYHPQDIAFFSWFFNAHHVPSLGAGGEFSSNGALKGPAKKCPTGGSFLTP